MTESGFIRVSSNSRAVPDARSPREAASLLREIRQVGTHAFWEDDVSLATGNHDVFDQVVGYRQVTDAHLLALAVRHGGRLATFDRGLRDLSTKHPGAVEFIP